MYLWLAAARVAKTSEQTREGRIGLQVGTAPGEVMLARGRWKHSSECLPTSTEMPGSEGYGRTRRKLDGSPSEIRRPARMVKEVLLGTASVRRDSTWSPEKGVGRRKGGEGLDELGLAPTVNW